MKRSSFILSLIIPGLKSLSKKIDAFLQPLIDELNELCTVGIETYDISRKENFQMHAALLWTINDFPGYSDLFGWKVKGPLACPHCNYDTHSIWLKHGNKFCYMGHRQFLDMNHKFRKDKINFDGEEEMEFAPRMRIG